MRFNSKPIEEHTEVPLADEGRWDALVEHWQQRGPIEAGDAPDRNACYVLSVHPRRRVRVADAQLAEILGLVEAQGDRVVGHEVYELVRPDPRMLVGSGVAERIGGEAREAGADMLVVDAELTPSQTRNLEDATGLPVCDREAVILNVFQRHATTRRARLQVEIAHLQYLRPRIRGIGLNMDQQAGGVMRGKGKGETASELLARRLDTRLTDLRRALVGLKQSDSARRRHRDGCARIALVGYTNAGKTSLMNALTDAGLSARDRPFETLDTTSRCLTRHGGDVLISDTVGFIRRLPDRLFASFESTLAEAREATLLLLVLDASDPELELHLATTREVLERLDAHELPRFYAFNKVDRCDRELDSERLARLSDGHPHMAVSAHDGATVARLREAVLEAVRSGKQRAELHVPYRASGLTAEIYASCRVLETRADERGTHFTIEGEPHVVERIARRCAQLGGDAR